MKALTVRQPYAGLIAAGVKTIELRTWSTAYRGPLLICAGKKPSGAESPFPLLERDLAPGVALVVVTLKDVRPYVASDAPQTGVSEDRLVDRAGFAWVLEDPQRVEQFEVRGMPGLFSVPDFQVCVLRTPNAMASSLFTGPT